MTVFGSPSHKGYVKEFGLLILLHSECGGCSGCSRAKINEYTIKGNNHVIFIFAALGADFYL